MSARALDRALRGGMAGLLLGLPLTTAMPARAAERASGAVPDSASMARIRAATGEHGMRVIGTFGQREVHHPMMDSTGVWSSEWAGARPAVFATSDAPHAGAQTPLPWSQIQEIKSDRQHKTHGALLGAGIGLVTGAVLLGIASGTTDDEQAGAGALMGGSVILGGVFGLFIGSLVGSKTIYRAQERP
jgi:hypothetical protein